MTYLELLKHDAEVFRKSYESLEAKGQEALACLALSNYFEVVQRIERWERSEGNGS